MNQHKNNTLTDVDTILVSSARRYNMFTQCTIKHIHTSYSPTRIPLVVGYHPATQSISSIFHKHKYILSSSQLCVTMFKYKPLITFLCTIKPSEEYCSLRESSEKSFSIGPRSAKGRDVLRRSLRNVTVVAVD